MDEILEQAITLIPQAMSKMSNQSTFPKSIKYTQGIKWELLLIHTDKIIGLNVNTCQSLYIQMGACVGNSAASFALARTAGSYIAVAERLQTKWHDLSVGLLKLQDSIQSTWDINNFAHQLSKSLKIVQTTQLMQLSYFAFLLCTVGDL